MEILLIFFMGASGYGIIELLWRGYTHWTMLLVGGICFLALYYTYAHTKINTFLKCLLGSLIITTIELISGIIINVKYRLNVWDYSLIPYNLYGQICLLYSIFWAFISYALVFLCKKLRNIIKNT